MSKNTMAQRLIEMVLPQQDGEEVLERLKEHKMLEHWQIRLSDQEVLVRILLEAEQSVSKELNIILTIGKHYANPN
jgi:hypothetical protein